MRASEFPQTFFLLLVTARCAATAAHNGSAIGRTFALGSPTITGELLDLESLGLLLHDQVPVTNGSTGDSRTAKNWTTGISAEARTFLSGPVSTVFIPSLYTLVFLVSVPLNALAVVTFSRQIRPMKPAAIYMLNLACADLLFALVLPFKVVYHFSGNDWMFGPAMCRVVTAAFYCNMHSSVLLITCISVDRLLAVVYPIDSLAWRRPRHAVLACVAMWIMALAGSIPLTFSEQTVHLKQLDITTCHDIQDLADLQWRYVIYFSTVSCALFLLPLLVTLACYTRVIWSLSRTPPGIARHSRRKARATVMALTVLIQFVVCFTPTNCVLLLHYLQYSSTVGIAGRGVPDGSYATYLVFMCVGSLNCCLDPLVYYFGSSQCQRQLSIVLGCGKEMEDLRKFESLSGSSRNTMSTILKSSLKKSGKANAPANKLDSFQAGLDSQYKKLLV